MENWGLNGFSHIGGVEASSGILWHGGEANLVIHHNVDGSSNLVTLKTAHLQSLRDYALASESCIAVNQNRKNWVGLGISQAVLLGPDNSLKHWVDGFKVGRVCSKRNLDLSAVTGGENTLSS